MIQAAAHVPAFDDLEGESAGNGIGESSKSQRHNGFSCLYIECVIRGKNALGFDFNRGNP
jgi:hypothetical protein